MDAEDPAPPGLPARLLITLTSPPLLPLAAAAHGLLLAGAVILYLWSLPPTPVHPETGELVTGDFVVFYVAAQTVLDGEGRRLYDHREHQARTRRLTGPKYTEELWYVNPPGFALALAPLAALPWRAAFYARALLLLALAVWTALLLRPRIAALGRGGVWLGLLLAFTFHPVLRTLVGGQNTTLTLFLLCGVTWGILREDAPGEVRWGSWTAGVFLGLLSYKPQFGLLPGLVLLARRDGRALLAATAVTLLHYLAGALVCGPGWPLELARHLAAFQRAEPGTNASTHISLLSVVKHVLPGGAASALASLASLAACAALVVACARAGDDRGKLQRLWALAIALGLLVSPHTQYYDVGVIVLPVLLLLAEQQQREVAPSLRLRLLLVLGFLGYPLYALTEQYPIPQPLVLWPALTVAWALTSGPSLLERADEPAPSP